MWRTFVILALALFSAVWLVSQTECVGDIPVENITVADATMHAGINLEYRQTDLGGLVTRIWDSAGAFDVRDDLCVFVNGAGVNAEVAAEEVVSGDVIEWWVWELPSTPVSLVASFVVE